MPIIRTHDYTLYGSNDIDIVLRPLCDDHLPLLYRWNADPELLYWTEGGEDIMRSYDRETVHDIYGGVSQNAHCFLVEADGVPIGECWLQRMNLPSISALYPGLDVRRIDMAIGEKDYWGKGIGSAFIRMMIDFAFAAQHIDVLHCFSEDYNIRSRKVWLKNSLKLVKTEEFPPPQKGKRQYHFALTRQEYMDSQRAHVPKDQVFRMPFAALQPSQLYISKGKLRLASEWFDRCGMTGMDPIPVIRLGDRIVMTDGHTRAVLACLRGIEEAPCYFDISTLNLKAYDMDVTWCNEENIHSPADLARRIVSPREYEELWRRRCMEMDC